MPDRISIRIVHRHSREFVSALFVEHRNPQRISAYAEEGLPGTASLIFLLPKPNLKSRAHRARPCFDRAFTLRIIPRAKRRKHLDVEVDSRFPRLMIRSDKTGSKLFACATRHAQVRRLSAACLRSTWQGEGKALPVASPLVCRKRHVETLPVSTPRGLPGVRALRSWAVCP